MKAFLTAQRGLTFTESLVALVLVSIVLVPLTVGLSSMVSSVSRRERLTALANAGRGKLEEVAAMGFANIPLSVPPGTPGALSDQVTIRSQTVPRNVIVDLADGDIPPDAAVDADLKLIVVEVGGFELHRYISSFEP